MSAFDSTHNSNLDLAFSRALPLRDDLCGKRNCLPGGMDSFGRWPITTFLDANRRLGLGVEMVVLSRNSDTFREKKPVVTSDQAVPFVLPRSLQA